jgi:hypothetical protein
MNGGMRTLLVCLAVSAVGCSPLTQGDVFASIPDAVVTTTDAGTPCTPPQDRPNWPVRVVFVVQNSGSMCVVDPPGSQGTGGFCAQVQPSLPGAGTEAARFATIRRFFSDNANRPNVSAAVVSYGENPTVFPFSATSAGAPAGLGTLATNLERASNLQGALTATRQLIEQDVLSTPASIRARSRYVVVVLSTGVPFPRCSSNDGLSSYASAANPSLTWADSVGAGDFCNIVTPDVITGFTPGGDLNQNAQLFGLVDDLLAFDTQYGLGDVRVFTRLLMNDANVMACGPICQDLFGRQSLSDTRTMGTWLLSQLATRGQGSFVDPGTPAMLNVSTIDTSEFTTFCGP